jgi:uncharacterized protein YydD (DUF2326 family)
MWLDQLTIRHGSKATRSIKFKKGLNLILDKPTSHTTQSGNNLGKTTVLRLIDFCLGSDGEDIWQDSEFKKSINQDVYDYLHGSTRVQIELKLASAQGVEHCLTRYFNAKKGDPDAFAIDDESYRNLSTYRTAVRGVLFHASGTKPSLRQLIPKFVRSSRQSMGKTLKVLGDYGSETDYEALHLFLFGFFAVDVLEQRHGMQAQRKKLERDLQALTRSRNQGEIEQLLIHLQREIEELSASNQVRGEVPEIAVHADRVSAIRARAANLTASLSHVDAEVSTIYLTIKELQSEYSNIDRHAIERIYQEAQQFIPKLHHDWAELSDFIQNLRGRKERFLQIQVADLEERADGIRGEILTLQQRERAEIGELMKSRAFNQALEVRADLQEKLKRLGSLEQDLTDIRELKSQIGAVEARLAATKEQIDHGKEKLRENVSIFNRYFSRLSKELYGEEYLLHFDETDKGSVAFRLSSVGSNVGSGKKMSQTAAFDLAYVDFLRETRIPFPTFVCHDGLESVHGNQLAALLNSASAMDGQLIVATLRDKLPVMPDGFITGNTVLELSQDDRLFRL